jgi:hypothetical protein
MDVIAQQTEIVVWADDRHLAYVVVDDQVFAAATILQA